MHCPLLWLAFQHFIIIIWIKNPNKQFLINLCFGKWRKWSLKYKGKGIVSFLITPFSIFFCIVSQQTTVLDWIKLNEIFPKNNGRCEEGWHNFVLPHSQGPSAKHCKRGFFASQASKRVGTVEYITAKCTVVTDSLKTHNGWTRCLFPACKSNYLVSFPFQLKYRFMIQWI